MTLPIGVVSGFDKVVFTGGIVGNSFGFGKFISHSSLPHNHSTNTEFLRNDSLYLRVKEVAVYSTLLPKTPSWQDPASNAFDSVCEFTLTEFSKRRKFDSMFSSASFYTHRHGYKICINVYVKGCGTGKNTHVSVMVQIMAGKNDDQLQWPFVGDVDIMLLNWRENKRHHKKTLSIPASSDCGLGRVLAGVVGRCRGYPQFISHSSLSYNRFINTEYLQDDCLRFRVNMVTKWLSCIDNKFVYFFEFTCDWSTLLL